MRIMKIIKIVCVALGLAGIGAGIRAVCVRKKRGREF